MQKLIFTCILFFVTCSAAQAAPQSNYWAIWDRYNEDSNLSIDHSPWQALLNRYLIDTTDGQFRLFRYREVTPEDRQQLNQYIASLTALDPRDYKKTEQKAYWLNLYNALTVKLILDNYPISSITKLGPWYSAGPWDEKIARIGGESLTLNDIEHRILRPLWRDNRIHYGVNCASLGCPDLSRLAFTAENTDHQLDVLARRFVNQTKGVEIEPDKLLLSKIYSWYASDFGTGREQLIQHLMHYADPDKREALSRFKGPLRYQYDWDLNDGS